MRRWHQTFITANAANCHEQLNQMEEEGHTVREIIPITVGPNLQWCIFSTTGDPQPQLRWWQRRLLSRRQRYAIEQRETQRKGGIVIQRGPAPSAVT